MAIFRRPTPEPIRPAINTYFDPLYSSRLGSSLYSINYFPPSHVASHAGKGGEGAREARGEKDLPPPLLLPLPPILPREAITRIVWKAFEARIRRILSYPVVYDVNVYAGASPVCRAITGRKLAAKLLVRKPDTQARYIWRKGCRVGGRVFRGKNRGRRKNYSKVGIVS